MIERVLTRRATPGPQAPAQPPHGCALLLLIAGLATCSLAACPEFPDHLLLEPNREAGLSDRGRGDTRDVGRGDTRDGPLDARAELDRKPPTPDRVDLWPHDLPAPDIGCPGPQDWWDVNYAFRRRLTVTETVSGPLTPGYSLALHLDTRGMLATSELLSSGDDLRVVYHDGVSHQELHRRLVGLDSTDTKIWFKSPAAVVDADQGYFIYYSNPGAGTPPAHWADSMGAAATPSEVYLAADDFEEHSPGDFPDGWIGSPRYRVELIGGNKVLAVNGADGPADYLFAGDLSWTDVVLSARLQATQTAGEHYGLWVRADGTSNFRTTFWGLTTNSELEVWSARISGPTADSLATSTKVDGWSLIPPAGSGWHRLAVRAAGQTLRLVFDGQQRGVVTLDPGQMSQGRIGLCAGYPASGAQWDDVVVRRHVTPEPVVAADQPQPRCP